MKTKTAQAVARVLKPSEPNADSYRRMEVSELRAVIVGLLKSLTPAFKKLVCAWAVYKGTDADDVAALLREYELLRMADKVADAKLHEDAVTKVYSKPVLQKLLIENVPVEQQPGFLQQEVEVCVSKEEAPVRLPVAELTKHQVNRVFPNGTTKPQPVEAQRRVLIQKSERREQKAVTSRTTSLDRSLQEFATCGKWSAKLNGSVVRKQVAGTFSKTEAKLVEEVAKAKGIPAEELVRRLVLSALVDWE